MTRSSSYDAGRRRLRSARTRRTRSSTSEPCGPGARRTAVRGGERRERRRIRSGSAPERTARSRARSSRAAASGRASRRSRSPRRPAAGAGSGSTSSASTASTFQNADGERRSRARRRSCLPETFDAVKSGFVAVAGPAERGQVDARQRARRRQGRDRLRQAADDPAPDLRRRERRRTHQLVLVDLPGFQRPLDPLTERMQRTRRPGVRGRRRRPVRPVRAGADRRGRPLHRAAGLRARRAGRDRAEQGRPPRSRATSRRRWKPRSKLGDFHALHPVSAKTGRRHRTSCADELVELLPEGQPLLPRSSSGPTRSHARIEVAELIREKALAAHARGGAARDLGRGRGARTRRSRARASRRDRVAEADPGRQGRVAW